MNLVDLAVIVFVSFLGFIIAVIGFSLFIVHQKSKKSIVYIGPGDLKEYLAIIGLKKNRGTEIIYRDPSISYVEIEASRFKDFLRDRKDHR